MTVLLYAVFGRLALLVVGAMGGVVGHAAWETQQGKGKEGRGGLWGLAGVEKGDGKVQGEEVGSFVCGE